MGAAAAVPGTPDAARPKASEVTKLLGEAHTTFPSDPGGLKGKKKKTKSFHY